MVNIRLCLHDLKIGLTTNSIDEQTQFPCPERNYFNLKASNVL